MRSSLPRSVFIVSIACGAFCFALTQVSNPKTLGITSEPGTIAFYGLFGLLTGLSGVVAVLSGGLWFLRYQQSSSSGSRQHLATLAYRAGL